MVYLLKTRVLIERKYPNPESEPTVLGLDDLLFSFNIWLGFCGISGIVFVAEFIFRMKFCRKKFSFHYFWKKFKFNKLKFAKVHQNREGKCQNCYENQKLTPKLLKSFRIKKPEPKIDENAERSTNVVADVHHRVNSDLELNNFGAKVEYDQNFHSESESLELSTEYCQFMEGLEIICSEIEKSNDLKMSNGD